jgi:hypothetical protein
VNALLVLLVAELFAFGAMWHNKSARSGMERESERPDPAVLFSRIRPQDIANGASLPGNATESRESSMEEARLLFP